ncbi:MAG: DUF2325 domain-containing protein [Motiliproteus sp.]|nr:DUF2325 domain-containing protein [Motiliproteus sp.]MCW9054053.1 DUF2325 domain-containing protein [Motiliproteus sp.]
MAKELTIETPMHSSRLKLWELPHHYHCAIIGTCLTIVELQKVARQSRLRNAEDLADYELHALMVQAAAQKEGAGRNLHKQLDRKYHRWLKRLQSLELDEFADYWDMAVEDGDVAGLFWSLMTHPQTPSALVNRVQQQVHMLSHLQGHSHHAKMQRGNHLQQQVKDLQQLLEVRQKNHHKALQQRDQLYQAQQKALQALQQQITQPAPDVSALNKQLQASEKRNRQLLKRLDWAEEQLSHREIRLTELLQGQEGLKEQLHEVMQEKDDLETSLQRFLISCSTEEQDRDSMDLEGRQLVYVGGRRSTLPHLRSLTESYNGTLIYHDGGLENNQSELHNHLNRADLVFCAIDCVSHNACLEVKRHCKKLEKPFVPLRSSSLSAFTSSLHNIINSLTYTDSTETLAPLTSQ